MVVCFLKASGLVGEKNQDFSVCHRYYFSDMHRMLWEHRESVSYFSLSLVGWCLEGQVLVLSRVL